MEKSCEEKPKPRNVAAAAAPPPPTVMKRGATPTHNPQPAAEEGFVKFILRSLKFMITSLILFVVWRNIFLGFELDSVSVSLHDDPGSSNITAVWDISFSIQPLVRDLTVSVRFMSRDFQVETVGVRNGNVTVNMLLPPDFVFPALGGFVLEQVAFECNFEARYGVKAVCESVAVEFAPNETKGIMKGGPISCPTVRYGRVYFFNKALSLD